MWPASVSGSKKRLLVVRGCGRARGVVAGNRGGEESKGGNDMHTKN